FEGMAVGERTACGITPEGHVECSSSCCTKMKGEEAYDYDWDPSGTFAEVDAGGVPCGVTVDGSITCKYGTKLGVSCRPPSAHDFARLALTSVFDGYNCAVDVHGNATCWGGDVFDGDCTVM